MKLTAQKDVSLDNDYVDVRYRELTPVIHQIFQLCEETGSVLLCKKEGATYKIDVNDVLYIESVDRKSCVYTKDDVFHLPTPLKQLEESLAGQQFVRVSKMALLNIYKINSVANGLHFRMTAEMSNSEKIVVGRRYREDLIEAISELAKEVSK
ncbi:MAG: LytTR family transcriptional regulator [Defluviitaleaceae bacterium]|nr:LytTR family transcriptional regulator [Defluviitaleaceae bacterium]MCL2239866.1 LytTR family transcriptional regulator [Defluviitaleaceae bacterium]